MNTLCQWMWENSLAGGLLAAGMLLLGRCARGRVPAAMLCAGGWLVVLRFLWPVPVDAPWAWDAPLRNDAPVVIEQVIAIPTIPTIPESAPAMPVLLPEQPAMAETPRISWQEAAAGAWALGAVLFFLTHLAQHGRMLLRLRRDATPAQWPWPGHMEDCMALCGLRRQPQVFTVPGTGSPYLCGSLRARLIFPQDTLAALTRDGSGHVLLHEMLHITRRDVAANWLFIAVRALHWWNPLIHLTAARLLRDREMVRDLQAVRLLGTDGDAYARTLLNLALTPRGPLLSPGLAPFFQKENELKHRILMIHSPARSRTASMLMATAATSLTACFFTTALGQEKEPPPAQPAPPAAITVEKKSDPAAAPATDTLAPSSDTAAMAEELKRLRQEVAELKQSVSQLHQREAPAGPSPVAAAFGPKLLEAEIQLRTLRASGLGEKHPRMVAARRMMEDIHEILANEKAKETPGISLLGELKRPGVYSSQQGGNPTLAHMIAMAGGFNTTANQQSLTLVTKSGKKTTIAFDAAGKVDFSGEDPVVTIIVGARAM